MTRIDFHGMSLEEAIAKIEQEIDNVRVSRKAEEYEFVVGYGIIRNELVKILRDYGIDHSVKLSKRGVITAVLE